MYKYFCQMHTGDYKMIEVAYKLDTKKKVATVFFEKPDAKLGFKTFTCEVPSYKVITSNGFTTAEVEYLMEFCKKNAVSFLKGSAW